MLDNQADQFIRVDEKDRILEPVSRSEANSNPEIIHRSIKVLVFNKREELLIQKRSGLKDTFPDCWDVSVAGHVDWGESYLEAALRETEEEIGLQLSESDLVEYGKLLIRLPWETEFQQAYRVEVANDIDFHFPEDEVSEVCFVSLNELKEMVAKDEGKWTTPALDHLRSLELI